MAPKPSIVLVHGLWMTPHSWNEWISRFERAGYTVLAPGWYVITGHLTCRTHPYYPKYFKCSGTDLDNAPSAVMTTVNKAITDFVFRPGIDNRSVADICADPSSLKAVTIADVVNRYEEVIKCLPTPPIIIGHSFGGLMVQVLLSRGLGCAGVAISAAGPAGVNVLTLSTIKSTFPILSNPFNQNGLIPLSLHQFNYIFTNELDEKESEKVYKEFCVPGSAHVLWQGALAGLHKSGDGEVTWDKPDRAPLLLIGGSKDHIVPESVPQTVVKTYTGPAIVEYKGFAGRTHHIVGQSGWEEVADYSLAWVEKHVK